MTYVIEELFKFNIIKVLLFAELALLKHPSQCFDHLMAHVDDTLAFNDIDGLFFNDTEGARHSLNLFAAFEELVSVDALLHICVE